MQATVSPWKFKVLIQKTQNSHNENSNLKINSSPVRNNFEIPIKYLPQISKSNGGTPLNRLIVNSKLRNNNAEVASNKIIIADEQFKNNI